jgi:hypothetical protein
MMRSALACCALFSLLAGCTTAELRNLEAGPYQVIKNNDFRIIDPVQQRELKVRVMYPDSAGPFPVVVFSTGMFCTPQLYDGITDHWVSHGYVVIEPNHPDSPNREGKIPYESLLNIIPVRMRDVSFLAASLDAIEAGMNIEGRMQQDRIAIAGHSFGAVISQIKTGMMLKEEYVGSYGPTYDDRFDVAVLLSGTGFGMKEFADNAFDGMRKPIFVSGGSEDIGRVNSSGMNGREWRKQPYLLSPPLDKYSLITEGTDHYMGGLICNDEKPGPPDYAAMATVRALTSVFLDAYLKDDPAALEFLHTADIPALTDGQAEYMFSLVIDAD